MGAEPAEIEHEQLQLPGHQLRAARQARNIDIDEIARWLKLDEKLILAIENNDDSILPEPVFTAGYIRSYARIVELSPDQLVSAYMQAHKSEGANLDKHEEPMPGKQGKVPDSLPKRFSIAGNGHAANIKWFALASIAIVLVGGVSWMSLLFFGSSDEAELASNEIQSLDMVVQKSERDVATAEFPISESQQAPSGGTAISKPKEKQEEQQDNKAVKRITVPLPLHKKERSDPGYVATIGEDGLPIVPSHALTSISVKFKSDSWIDIRDATGKALIRSLGVAGANKKVEGVAPFQVLIGYGPGVEMKYDGRPFDFTKFQGKQEVARFTLRPPVKQNKNTDQN